MNQAIIFDLDGTLIDSCGVCVGILASMIADRGVDHRIDVDYARLFMSRGGESMVSALLGPALRDPKNDIIEFRARYRETATPISALYHGVVEGLSDLHSQGYTLAICSNKPQDLCKMALADTGILSFFSVVVGGGHDLRPKPAPDMVNRTLADLDMNSDQCLYVGDSEIDYHAALQAQIPFFYMAYGYGEKGWVPPHCDVFNDFSTLTDALLKFDMRTPA